MAEEKFVRRPSSRARRGLLSEIERDLLADRPVATILRKLLLLGGQSGSPELRMWASKELRGYDKDDELPSYRSIPAPIQMDGMNRWAKVTGQQVGLSELPDFARERINERVELAQGVGEIESMARHNAGDDRSVMFGIPGSRDLARYMQSESGSDFHIDRFYWRVSKVALEGVVDQIRTRLTELMAELRSLTPSTQVVPNAQQAQAAYNIVIEGKNPRVVINTIHGAEGSHNTIETDQTNQDDSSESAFWVAGRRVAGVILGLVAIAGLAVAVLQLQAI